MHLLFYVQRGFLTKISEKQTSRMNMLIRDRSLAVQQLVLIHDIKEEKG